MSTKTMHECIPANICITFVQCRPNVFDVGPALYKCYTNVLCLLGYIHVYWLIYWHISVCKSQQTQNICITFVQRRLNVLNVGPTLYKCYTNVVFTEIYTCLFAHIHIYCHISVCRTISQQPWDNVVLLLVHRLRRWPNSKATLGQRLMFAGI